MRHYVVTTMIAFLTLAVTNLIEDLPKKAPGFCKFLGFAYQYLFLVSFMFMAAMSSELWLQIS
jgi:hypothetical protein